MEYGHEHMEPDPSFGSHFFQNITSLHLGYFTLNTKEAKTIDWEWMKNQKVVEKDPQLIWVETKQPLAVEIDGRIGKGHIIKSTEVEDIMDEQESPGI